MGHSAKWWRGRGGRRGAGDGGARRTEARRTEARRTEARRTEARGTAGRGGWWGAWVELGGAGERRALGWWDAKKRCAPGWWGAPLAFRFLSGVVAGSRACLAS